MAIFKLGWDRAMEMVHLEHWVPFMDDSELEMWYKEKLGLSRESKRLAEMSKYEQDFLEKDIQTLAREIHKRKFSHVLYKMRMNMKLLKIMDQMEVYYMYHLHEPCPSFLKKNVRNRVVKFMEQQNIGDDMLLTDEINYLEGGGNEEKGNAKE